MKANIDERASVCVVMASGGYPGIYAKRFLISGLEDARKIKNVIVFHSGTASEDGNIFTNGGRVLGITAIGDSVKEAIATAYQAVSKITWEGAHYRRDIGQKALRRLETAPQVGIVMGSDSDLPVMEEAAIILNKFGVPYEMTVASAHRSPVVAAEFAGSAIKRGIKVIIAGAGHAAHLSGSWQLIPRFRLSGFPLTPHAFRALIPCCQRFRCLQVFRWLPFPSVSPGQRMPVFWRFRYWPFPIPDWASYWNPTRPRWHPGWKKKPKKLNLEDKIRRIDPGQPRRCHP